MTKFHHADDLAFELAVEVSPDLLDRSKGSLRLTARPIRETDEGLRSVSWSSSYDTSPGHELADLMVSGYANNEWSYTYGSDVAIHDPYDVDLERARHIVWLLGMIERRLAKRAGEGTANYDPPTSYTDLLLRVASILQVSRFGAFGERRPNGSRPWQIIGGPEEAAAWIDARIAEFREQYPLKEETS